MDTPQDVERLSDPALLADVDARTAEQIRALRDGCRDNETAVSYHRRVAQGRLDIARAERERRDGPGEATLVDSLAGILADHPSSGLRSQHVVPVVIPELSGAGTVPSITDLPDLDAEQLDDRIEQLERTEQELSSLRRGLLDNLDALQDELVARYRDGRAAISDLTDPEADQTTAV